MNQHEPKHEQIICRNMVKKYYRDSFWCSFYIVGDTASRFIHSLSLESVVCLRVFFFNLLKDKWRQPMIYNDVRWLDEPYTL